MPRRHGNNKPNSSEKATLHGRVSSVMVPGSEEETESEAHRTRRTRVRIAIPKNKFSKRDGTGDSYLEALKSKIGIVNKQ